MLSNSSRALASLLYIFISTSNALASLCFFSRNLYDRICIESTRINGKRNLPWGFWNKKSTKCQDGTNQDLERQGKSPAIKIPLSDGIGDSAHLHERN